MDVVLITKAPLGFIETIMYLNKFKQVSIIVAFLLSLFVLASFFLLRDEQISEGCHVLPEEVVGMINRNLSNTGLFIDNAFFIRSSAYKGYYVASSFDVSSENNTVLVWLTTDIYIPINYLSVSHAAKNESMFQKANLDQVSNIFDDKNYLKIRNCVKNKTEKSRTGIH